VGLTEKLKLLEENIRILKDIKKNITLEDIKSNKRYEWEIRYGLLESIQIVIDIACKVASEYNLGNPKTYRACIELLQIDYTLAQKIAGMVGLRNLLIHEYIKIDEEKLYQFLENLDNFVEFAMQIEKYL